MPHIRLILFSVISFVLLMPVFSQKKKEGKAPEIQLTQDQAIYAEATLIEAEKQVILENYSKAYELFLKAADLTPGNAAIHFKLAEVLVKNGENQKGLENITRAIALDPGNKYYYLFQADIHKALNDYKSAAKSYESLIRNVPNTQTYWLDLALIYKYQSQWEKALNAFEAAEEALGKSYHILREKQQIYLQQNQMDLLKADWEALIAENPGQPEYPLELIGILLANDMVSEAEPLISQFKQKYPTNDHIYLIQSEVERMKGDYRKALAQLIVPAGSTEVELTTKIQAINAYLPFIQTEAMYQDLIVIVQKMVKAHPNSYEALGFAGDVYLSLDSTRLALDYYRQAVQFGQTNFGVWQNIVNLEYQNGNYDSLVQYCEQAIEFFPNQPIFYFYSGLGYLILEDYRKSVRSLEQGLEYTHDKSLKALFYGQLGDAYYHREELEKAYASYDQCLSIQPDNYPVLNNYSYYLSLRGDHLDKALTMSTRLVANNPEDATFLDTHGWVLFVRGDYVKAHQYLQKAAELKEDGTIVEHLGDVLFKLGEVEQALETWKKAKELGETSDQIDKKIEDKKYYE